MDEWYRIQNNGNRRAKSNIRENEKFQGTVMLGVVVIRRIWTIKVWINTVHKATITTMWNKILGREFAPFVAHDLSNVGLVPRD